MILPRTREEYTAWALSIPVSWHQYEQALLIQCTTASETKQLRESVYEWIRYTSSTFPDLIRIEPHEPATFPLYTLSIAGINMGILEQSKLNEIFEDTP